MQKPTRIEHKVFLKTINKMDSRLFQNIFSYFLQCFGGYSNFQSFKNWVREKNSSVKHIFSTDLAQQQAWQYCTRGQTPKLYQTKLRFQINFQVQSLLKFDKNPTLHIATAHDIELLILNLQIMKLFIKRCCLFQSAQNVFLFVNQN